MKNRQLLLLGTTIMLFMTACGNNKEQPTNTPKTSISRFEVDSNTIKQKDESLLISLNEQQEIKEEQKDKEDPIYNSNEHIGELNIKNENNNEKEPNTELEEPNTETEESGTETEEPSSEVDEHNSESSTEESNNVSEIENTPDIQLAYEINGNDIIYNSVTYTDLYSNIQKVEQQSQYDTDTLIKFILQSYPSSEQVYTFMQMYSDVEFEDGDDYNDILIDETLSNSSDAYNNICNKYNDRATWMLTINKWMGKDKAMLAGCKSFTIIIGTDEDIEVDVSDFE